MPEANSGEGGNGAGNGGTGGTGFDQEKFNTLLESVGKLTDGLTQQQAAIGSMAARLQELGENRSGRSNDDDDDDDDAGTQPDLEEMSRAEFGEHLFKRIVKQIDKGLKGLEDKISGVERGVSARDIKAEVSSMTERHKDFMEWRQEMGELLKENPSLSVKRLYNLARLEDPDKADKLDQKYKQGKYKEEASGDDGAKGSKGGRKNGFGGLPPGSSRADRNTKQDAKTAAESAWDEVMKDVDLGALGEGV